MVKAARLIKSEAPKSQPHQINTPACRLPLVFYIFTSYGAVLTEKNVFVSVNCLLAIFHIFVTCLLPDHFLKLQAHSGSNFYGNFFFSPLEIRWLQQDGLRKVQYFLLLAV